MYYYRALVVDYDGTIATHGQIDNATAAALRRVRNSGRRLILVTGRILEDLERVCDRLDHFDLIVAENGAVVHRPGGASVTLASQPPSQFVEVLRMRGVDPLSVGHVIVATWEPNETAVLGAIRDLGLELQIIFNKSAVMVLPSGVNKASGLETALDELGLSPHNVIGVGDAENDHAFLQMCGCAVAVVNALPMVKADADLVTKGPCGAGVAELVDRLLASDLRELGTCLDRRCTLVGRGADGRERFIRWRNTGVLVAGTSGSGKSTLTRGVIERLAEQGYQFCIVDPEGDYEGFEKAVTVGDAGQPPRIAEVMDVLTKPKANVVVNLLGVPLEDRPALFTDLLSHLKSLRAQHSRPHWVVVDEAHHMLPAERDPATSPFESITEFILVTVHPDKLSSAALSRVDTVATLGQDAGSAMAAFLRHVGEDATPLPAAMPPGRALIWDRQTDGTPAQILVAGPAADHRRHTRKYAEGDLGPGKSFYFRGPENKLNLRVQNLALFVQIAQGVDDETWHHHLRAGDYSRWFRDMIKDKDLADEATRVEEHSDLPASETRAQIRSLVEARYTGPA